MLSLVNMCWNSSSLLSETRTESKVSRILSDPNTHVADFLQIKHFRYCADARFKQLYLIAAPFSMGSPGML